MAIFVGFTLLGLLSNQRRYEIVLSEIIQYLKAHEHELTVSLYPNRFLNFQPLYGGEMVSLPLSIYHLRTTYFKIHINAKPADDVKKFAAITWEVLNILKENFPSHIHLFQENLEVCEPEYKPLSAKEELRRQLSCLMSKQEVPKALMPEEIDDVWYLLEACLLQKESKGITTCLELLDSSHHCPQQLLKASTTEANLKLLDSIMGNEGALLDASLEINSTLAKKILLKVYDTRSYDGPKVMTEHDLNRLSGTESVEKLDNPEDMVLIRSFDQPPSLRVCLFQLAESNDVERATFILQTISKYPRAELQQLKKGHIIAKCLRVLQKYCNGDYGFDQEVSRLGCFQWSMCQCLIVLSDNLVDFMELVQGGLYDCLAQLLEEAFIFIYDKTINGCLEWNTRLPHFLSSALRLFELGVNLKCEKYFPSLRSLYARLDQRLLGLTTQEVNVAKVFKTYFEEKLAAEPEPEKALSNELKVVCPMLYNAQLKLHELVTKLDALREYAETHQEKYAKLFPRGTPPVPPPQAAQILPQTRHLERKEEPPTYARTAVSDGRREEAPIRAAHDLQKLSL